MSKILNVRLPNADAQAYSPQNFNQLVRSLEQVIFQLNNSYTPQATENNQTTLDWYSGALGPLFQGALQSGEPFAYGEFLDFDIQSADTVDTPTAITWGTTAYSRNVEIDGTYPSRVNFARSGKYFIYFTAELHSESANTKRFYFWPRLNGVDITGSTMVDTLHNNDQRQVTSRGALFQINRGDYLEAMFAVDDLDADLHGLAATAFCPAAPSVTLVVIGI